MIKIIYAVLLGVMLAFFVGLGIEAFYPGEKFPSAPASLQYSKPAIDTSNDQIENTKIQKEYDQTINDYQSRNKIHARNVSLIAIISSILFMILSLTILSHKDVFADGFLIGSLLTLFYGIARGFESDDNKFRFIIITVGLIFALLLGYFKFIHQENKTAKKDN